jgi:hypothetical protein
MPSIQAWYYYYYFVALVHEPTIPTERPLLVSKVNPNFCRWSECCVVSVAESYGRNLGSLDQSHYLFFQVAPQLFSWCWVDPIPDPLLLRKSVSARNQTQTSGSVARNSDHWTTEVVLDTSIVFIIRIAAILSTYLFISVIDFRHLICNIPL